MTDRHRNVKQHFSLAAIALSLAWPGASQPVTASERMAAWFKDPPAHYRSRPLHWLNAPLEPAALRVQIQAMRDQCGFGGFAPLTLRTAKPDYLTEGFFERYALMLETAGKLGLKVIFYDDINFPTGTAGGRLAKQFPDSTLKNLRKVEKECGALLNFGSCRCTFEQHAAQRTATQSGRCLDGLDNPLDYGLTDDVIRYLALSDSISVVERGG